MQHEAGRDHAPTAQRLISTLDAGSIQARERVFRNAAGQIEKAKEFDVPQRVSTPSSPKPRETLCSARRRCRRGRTRVSRSLNAGRLASRLGTARPNSCSDDQEASAMRHLRLRRLEQIDHDVDDDRQRDVLSGWISELSCNGTNIVTSSDRANDLPRHPARRLPRPHGRPHEQISEAD